MYFFYPHPKCNIHEYTKTLFQDGREHYDRKNGYLICLELSRLVAVVGVVWLKELKRLGGFSFDTYEVRRINR